VQDANVRDRHLEQCRSFHVSALLSGISLPFQVRVDIWEPRNAVHCASAQVQLNCFLLVCGSHDICSLDEIIARGQEFGGVFHAVAIVNALLHQGLEDGREVLEFAIMERVERAFTWELPLLEPKVVDAAKVRVDLIELVA
jgi:hypothetical protein